MIKSRTKFSGIISIILLISSEILLFRDFLLFEDNNYVSTFKAGIICGIFSVIFALIGIIKPQKTEMGKMLCSCGIGCPILFSLFVLFLFIIFKNTEVYTDTYLYDKDRNKINYFHGEGYFKYDRLNLDDYPYEFYFENERKFYYEYLFYGSQNSDKDPGLPYCYYLCSEDDPNFSMIDLDDFCKYNNITLETHEDSKTTEIINNGKIIILPWEKYQANDKYVIYNLKYPIMHWRNNTYVGLEFLYQTGFIDLHDEEACVDFIKYLKKVNDYIYKNGEVSNGIYTYKGNEIAGACTYFYNNELFEDSKIKIGMNQKEVFSILGESSRPIDKKYMDYPYFWMELDENQNIRLIEVDWEGVYNSMEKMPNLLME